ncbi:MAG: hypothetical protein RMK98_08875 [Bacteroidia bacterium]|nr:hypothetical protein [Bacteroidia bacterium]
MEENTIQQVWHLISEYHEKHLQSYGVTLPRLWKRSGDFSKDALTLVLLAQGYPNTRWVSKRELTDFTRKFYPQTPDVQNARHLGMQKGFYIVSSRRGNFYPPDKPSPKESAYLLVTLEKPHPSFRPEKRTEEVSEIEFEQIKKEYNYRCATCGSEEGKENLRYPGQITQLQKAHRNPHKPLTHGNILPQCQLCNRADRNQWIYDERGRVVGIASIRPIVKSVEEGYIPLEEAKFLLNWLSSYISKSS